MRRQCIGTCKKYICSSSATFNSYTSSGLRSWIFRYESVGPKSEPFKPECFHVSQPNAKPGPESNAHLTVSQQVHTRILAISLLWMYNWNAHLRFYKISSIASLTSGLRTIKIGRAKRKPPLEGFIPLPEIQTRRNTTLPKGLQKLVSASKISKIG